MSLQVLHRPKSFKTFIGNRETIEAVQNLVSRENPPSAFLFTGSGGTGKTTIARIIKRELKCSDADFKELNAADDRGIDAIRKLIEQMRFRPLAGEKKVFLLDEAHMLTKTAQEALLKALEEPPSYVHWVICTTNPEALKQTFKRRCHTYELEALKDADIQKLIRIVLKREKIAKFDNAVRDKVVELADGSAGMAMKLLDMVIDMTDPAKALTTLKASGSGESEVIDICRALMSDMPAKSKWAKVRILLRDYKGDGETARRPILGYFSSIMLNNGGDEVFFMMQPFKQNFFDSGKAGLVSACYEAVWGQE